MDKTTLREFLAQVEHLCEYAEDLSMNSGLNDLTVIARKASQVRKMMDGIERMKGPMVYEGGTVAVPPK